MKDGEKQKVFRVGAHNSISGGVDKALDRAVELRASALQFFSHNVRSWKKKQLEAEEVKKFRRKYLDSEKIKYAVIHSSYLINLASPKDKLRKKSIESLKDELIKADKLGIPDLNTHIGAHTGSGREAGLEKIRESLNELSKSPAFSSSEVNILLENTAGSGTTLGKNFSEIGFVLEGLDRKDRFGVCFDTCHGYAAGYPLATRSGLEETLEDLRENFDISKLKLVHVNDTESELGSNVDRHEHIGKGNIGSEGFLNILNHPQLCDLPFILETPKEEIDGEDGDLRNLKKLKELRDK